MKIKEFKLGSDPELFLRRKDTGDLFPAIGLINGTKNKPEKMKGLSKGFTWQVDNMSLEFNTPPASNKQEWIKNHILALDYIKSNIPDNLEIALETSGEFNPEYLEMPGAREFGCSSTYDAWKLDVNPKPYCENERLRCNGGHLHIGFEEGKDMHLAETLIRTLDLFCTIPSLFLDPDKERRKLYGKAGEFRFATSYVGCEHRSLSNFWLNSEEYMGWVYEQVEKAIQFINEGKSVDDNADMIQLAINNADFSLADKLIQMYEIKLPETKLILI